MMLARDFRDLVIYSQFKRAHFKECNYNARRTSQDLAGVDSVSQVTTTNGMKLFSLRVLAV